MTLPTTPEPLPGDELPDIQQADLSPAELRAYFKDIAELSNELSISYRQQLRGQNLLVESVERLAELLHAGVARAARLEYRFQGKRWLDTLLFGPESSRLVRIAEQ